MLSPWKESCDKPRQRFKKQRRYFANKSPSSQSCGFSISRVWMWELDNKESWVSKNWCFQIAVLEKNWCFQIVVLEKNLEGVLNCKEIRSVNSKGNQSRIFIERTGAEVEGPVFWPLMWRADSLVKTLMLGMIEGRRRKGHRGWNGWIASLTQWTVGAKSTWWSRTGKPGVLHAVHGVRVSQTRCSDWTTPVTYYLLFILYVF